MKKEQLIRISQNFSNKFLSEFIEILEFVAEETKKETQTELSFWKSQVTDITNKASLVVERNENSVQEVLKQKYAWRKVDAAKIMGQSRQTLWRAEKDGRFPKAKLYGNSEMYDTRDLLAWLENPNRNWS